MPRDSNGNYSLPIGYLAVTGEPILASQHNPPLEDLAAAMTASLPRNGSAAYSAMFRINMSAPAVALQDTDGRSGFLLADDNKLFVTRGAINGVVWDDGPNDRHPLTINLETGAVTSSGEFTGYGLKSMGAIEAEGAPPSLWLHYPSVKRGRLWIKPDGSLNWTDVEGQNHFFISPTGAVWTQQFGDLNTRIETRANDYANAAIAAATAICNDRVYRVRMVGYGETGGTGGMTNVAPGVFTGAAGSAYGAHTFGYRTLQQHIPAMGGWVNVSVE